jgi:hypothetical protein
MKKVPTPRKETYPLYWYFAAERQRIFERRVQGAPDPWTDDRILRQYKFCSVFRAADRVSQYLIRNVAYHPEKNAAEDRLFQIVAFRMFSRISTWNSILEKLERPPLIRDLENGAFVRALEHARRINGGLYTGAFILCANDAFGKKKKHLNHAELLRRMFTKGKLGAALLGAKSLGAVYQMLHEYPLMGDFMSYQIAIDLNYSSYLAFSENDFTQPGPGAVRGLRKAFHDLGDYSPQEAIMWMVDRQQTEFKRHRLTFGGLWGRALHAIDCQGLFCELDKYCREALPQLASARTRIKARFSPSSRSISLFFPPKWGLNDQLPKRPVMGVTHASTKTTATPT